MKSLDAKLAAYRENPDVRDSFIIADAKDPDMAFGIRALGHRRYLSGRGAHPAASPKRTGSSSDTGAARQSCGPPCTSATREPKKSPAGRGAPAERQDGHALAPP